MTEATFIILDVGPSRPPARVTTPAESRVLHTFSQRKRSRTNAAATPHPPPPLTNGPGLLLDQLFNLLAPPTLRNKDKLSSSRLVPSLPPPSSRMLISTSDAYLLVSTINADGPAILVERQAGRQGACY